MRKLKLILAGMIVATGITGCASEGNQESAALTTSETAQPSLEEMTEETTEEATTEEETTAEETTEEETTIAKEYIPWETEEEIPVDYSVVNQVYESDAKEREDFYSKVVNEKTSPIMNIVTEDGKKVKTKEYHPVAIDLFNCGEEHALSSVNAEVKVRGNSSANSSPYPYRIRFESKQNLLGLHDGEEYRSWVMLKPYWTFCPNFLALNLAKTFFAGEYYVSDCEYVNLYMNGEYQGIYLICEQNQAIKGRVEVNDPKYGEINTNIGYFFEMDNNIGDDHPYFNLNYKKRVMTDMLGEEREIPEDNYSVISDIWCDAQLQFINNYLDGVYEILYSAVEENKAMAFDENYSLVPAENMTPYEAIEAVVDINSFKKMLLLEELVQNYDVGAGSFYFCVDFSDDAKYNKLTLTCPWDFNWAYEKPANKNYYASTWQQIRDNYDRSNIWFVLLMKSEEFRNEFYSYVEEVEKSGELKDTLSALGDKIEEYRNDLGDDNWMVDKGHEIMNFVKNRMKFLVKESDSYFNGGKEE